MASWRFASRFCRSRRYSGRTRISPAAHQQSMSRADSSRHSWFSASGGSSQLPQVIEYLQSTSWPAIR